MNIRTMAKPASKPLFEELSAVDRYISKLKADIAVSITKKRLSLGMTQTEFARHAGVSQSLISRWESGECNFTIRSLAEFGVKIGLNLNVSISDQMHSGTFAFGTLSSCSVGNSIIPVPFPASEPDLTIPDIGGAA